MKLFAFLTAALVCGVASAADEPSRPPVRGTIANLIEAEQPSTVATGETPDVITGAVSEPVPDEALEGTSVAELIASQSLAENERDLEETRGRWALRELLEFGFAQTPTVEKTIDSIVAQHVAMDALMDAQIRLMRDDEWLEGFQKSVALASLRPFATHQAARISASSYDIPIADHELVDQWIDYFTGRGRWFFERWLGRSERYIPMMQPILEQYGIPKDLVYLAMIESGFSSKAYSVAAASGYWQFIRGTAKTYGMHMDAWVDERRDFIIATHAAARYLKQLHDQFGDWHLAWAGYNAGAGRISRALAKTGATSFFQLVELNALPRETQNYVPKIIAAAIVAKNKERFGFAGYDALKPLVYEEIQVSEALDMKLVARELRVEAEVMHELNPMLVYDITPPGKTFTVRVPVGTGTHIKQWSAALPPSARLTYATHRITKGDTLGSIAKLFGTTTAMVQDFNHIKSAKSLRLGQELIIPSLRGLTKVPGPKDPTPPPQSDLAKLTQMANSGGTPVATETVVADTAAVTTTTAKTSPAATSKPAATAASATPVPANPNDAIAAMIVARNRDQTLTNGEPVPRPPKPAPPPPPTPVVPKNGKLGTHVVEAGDTLWSISQKYGTTVVELRRWNGMRGSSIKAGDKLKVYTTQ
jgi:membrane-bound lytic murein transglycosylase D